MEKILLLLFVLILAVQLILLILQFNQKKQVEDTLKKNADEIKDYSNLQNNNLIDRIDIKINDIFDRNRKFENDISSNLNLLNKEILFNLNEAFIKQHTTMETRLDKIDANVNESLNEGFKKTQSTFTDIVSRLSKIDEAQKKIESLSSDIVSLQDVLTDKSARGAFGEIQLNQILSSIFGDKNDALYRTQHTFSNGRRADAVLFAPAPLGTVAIDSKFPLENYRKLIEIGFNAPEYTPLKQSFSKDIKKHIDDISSRYIIEGETSNQALLFVPAEAIFAYINAYHQDVITYAQSKRVWLASPTTLMSTLTMIQTILINMKRDEYTHVIQLELRKLEKEFSRYSERWDKLNRSIDRIGADAKDIHITTEKITNKFKDISNVERIEDSIDS